MPAVDETAERKLSAKVSRPILSCKHGSWDTWNVLMKNYINVHDGWNEIVFENRLKDVAKKRLPSKPRMQETQWVRATSTEHATTINRHACGTC